MKYAIGIDIGGTKIEACLMDEQGRIYDKKRVPSEMDKGREKFLENIITCAKSVSYRGIDYTKTEGIGIGIAGILSRDGAMLKRSPNLDMNDFPLKKQLEKAFNKRVILENDANCFAYAEYLYGAAKGMKNVVGVILGTGVGSGIVIDGRIYQGSFQRAGELGHTIIEKDGRLCGCGKKGCTEAYCSGPSFLKRFIEVTKTRESRLKYELGMNPSIIEIAANKGDKVCNELMNEYYNYLAIAFDNVINMLNPDIIVVGGGMSNFKGLYKEVNNRLRNDPYIIYKEEVNVVKAKNGDSAGVLGAGALVFTK